MKRTVVLFPFFLSCLGLVLLGCHPQATGPETTASGSDSVWARYLVRYESDSVDAIEKRRANPL
ncbi:hypothetical protein RB2501_06130 [Robiginitalea biformata HTCC2501]|uniref:Uncharacterized protein n=1 Tax=Robiginitalea biformata (strain ATCC BAA-864 / DSM 15991 / KCTC 12146 / HTCC2501) TaxID=313596 RepID=A4CHP6_ROBBH|nr:hypothetical protein RB2501_06130 [Robiginitalea biformata HTCC2501]